MGIGRSDEVTGRKPGVPRMVTCIPPYLPPSCAFACLTDCVYTAALLLRPQLPPAAIAAADAGAAAQMPLAPQLLGAGSMWLPSDGSLGSAQRRDPPVLGRTHGPPRITIFEEGRRWRTGFLGPKWTLRPAWPGLGLHEKQSGLGQVGINFPSLSVQSCLPPSESPKNPTP